MDPSLVKCDYLRILFIALVIILVLIFLIMYLFENRFLVTDKSLLEYLIENEQRSLFAAKLLSQEDKYKPLANAYIQRQEESIQRLENLLASEKK